jgi:hypothetical protein
MPVPSFKGVQGRATTIPCHVPRDRPNFSAIVAMDQPGPCRGLITPRRLCEAMVHHQVSETDSMP